MQVHPSQAQVQPDETHDFKIKDVYHFEPIRIVIGLTITFCMLWFLIVFILYQLTQIAANQ